MATKTQLEAIETKLINAMSRNMTIGSYTIGGRTFTYRTLDELRKALMWVQQQIAGKSVDGQSTQFQLARFTDA